MRRVIVFAALLYSALPADAGKVTIDFAHGRPFSQYKTYSWVAPDQTQGADAVFPNQLMQGRIIGLIEEALAAKGLRRVPSGGDLLIHYAVQVAATPIYTTFNDSGWGWNWNWGGGISTTTEQLLYHSTLVVDLTDAKHSQLVFQGVSTQDVSSKPTGNTKKFAKAVKEIFERYPPAP